MTSAGLSDALRETHSELLSRKTSSFLPQIVKKQGKGARVMATVGIECVIPCDRCIADLTAYMVVALP